MSTEIIFRSLRKGYDWIVKNKVYHLFFWFFYHFLWWTIFKGGVSKVFHQISDPMTFVSFVSFVIFQATGVYFCLYYLIPRYLEKSKYILYITFVIVTILVIALLIIIPNFVWCYFLGGEICFNSLSKFFWKNTLPSSIGSMTLGMSIKLAKNWLSSQKKQQILEKEKLETELKFLRSQFNPHFLFNTINSIFVLINKNTEMATESLVKFSELLRYQLYECNASQIPLHKEISYLRSFIELEELRQNDNFILTTELPSLIAKNFSIAPFLLMPFIENAFKHISCHTDVPNKIDIKIVMIEDQFVFDISNTVSHEIKGSVDAVEFGGLGLKNVKRRLMLLYPDNYTLNISQSEQLYKVKLTLNLTILEGN
ncbi:sensor histidine kinase [Aquimarina pacifica]|uniref:sensor histidine kinase n=1 Tax=Aquimarina pacifica TaxID=1296415 RepID=UPI0004705715|nr:histidine kinase [Aquimarina pacifica]